jgi:hypothetical protein
MCRLRYFQMVLLSLFFPLFLLSQITDLQYDKYGDYTVPKLADWQYVQEKSNDKYFVFGYKSGEVEVGISKVPIPCTGEQEFNAKILGLINGLSAKKEYSEQRKQSAPLAFLGLTSSHLINIKSRETGKRRFLYHPFKGNKMYEISVTEQAQINSPGDNAIQFLSLIYLSSEPDGKANAALAAEKLKKLRPTDIAVRPDTKIKERDTRLDGIKKVKTPEEVIDKTDSTGDNGYDPEISKIADNIPDGDEESQVINEIGKETYVPQDAGWALELLKNPKELLDALDGGRPGGEVNTMVALLRQMQGPFDEQEEKSLMNQYAPHANAATPKGRNSIKAQNEILLRAMLHNQLAVQAAWEYDFALSSHEIARLMEDEDEMEISLMLAEIQELLMESQHQQIQNIIAESQRAEQVPAADELTTEDTEMRNNAIRVVESIYNLPEGTLQSGGSTVGGDENYALVQRYFALREEHRMLKESCDAGNVAACKEASEVYKEGMEIRKNLEAKGIDVFTYKPKEPLDPNPFIGKEYLEPIPSKQDPSLTDEQNQAIAEHEYNIAAAQRAMASFRNEMLKEQDPVRREQLRLQALHMAQNIHDSKDLIESIRTGSIVQTRGPWDEHSAVVLAETSRKLREDFQRVSQMQASYVQMLNVLKKYNPEEAKKWSDQMHSNVTKGIFDKGGFERAQSALNELHKITKGAAQTEQRRLEADQTKAFERLETVERHLRYAENIKSGCDKAVFVGTLFTGMAPGMLLSMAYEGATTAAEKGPVAALKNVGIQVGTMLAMKGIMKAGSWGINKILNPKIAPTNSNKWKDILDANRYQQEMEWNRALVNNLKDKAIAFEKAKAAGGKNYLAVRQALDDAVSAANSSSLAKRIMKNELTMLQNQIKSGATRDYGPLRQCLSYQKVYDNRLQKSIYPRTDAQMIKELQKQGYNHVKGDWFQEYRNACSIGVNADRDLGLLAKYERVVYKNGQPVSMSQFMKDAQKAYDSGYKAVTGRSSKLADQSITTSAHSESFPLSWLQKKMEGPFTTLDPPVTPQDFQKAGGAIFNKVKNALAGPDPAFVNMKKACASLSKDLKSKVFDRLMNPPANSGISPTARKAAMEHWQQVQKVMEDFASDRSDPLTTMKKLQQLTGSTSITQSAGEVQKLLNKLAPVK